MRLTVFLAFLAFLAHERNSMWTNAVRLWVDAASKSPGKGRAHANLGKAFVEAGMNELAIGALRRAISLDPSDVDSYLNLGNALQAIGRYQEAVKEYLKALKILPGEQWPLGITDPYPKAWKIHNNLGNALREMNMLDQAIEQHLLALSLKPASSIVHLNLGRDYERKGDLTQARKEFLKALSLDPTLQKAREAVMAQPSGPEK